MNPLTEAAAVAYLQAKLDGKTQEEADAAAVDAMEWAERHERDVTKLVIGEPLDTVPSPE